VCCLCAQVVVEGRQADTDWKASGHTDRKVFCICLSEVCGCSLRVPVYAVQAAAGLSTGSLSLCPFPGVEAGNDQVAAGASDHTLGGQAGHDSCIRLTVYVEMYLWDASCVPDKALAWVLQEPSAHGATLVALEAWAGCIH
jgi:hypothetical protein